MEKVTEATKVEVGKFYLVPCAKMKRFWWDEFFYVPILGIEHADPQFGVNFKHYHVDGRFATPKDVYPVNSVGKTNGIVCTDNEYRAEKTGAGFDVFVEIVYRKKKCKRLTTGLDERLGTPKKITDWREKHKGRSCQGKKCPHLGTIMHERGDELVCPLHGLIGDLKTEIII